MKFHPGTVAKAIAEHEREGRPKWMYYKASLKQKNYLTGCGISAMDLAKIDKGAAAVLVDVKTGKMPEPAAFR